MRYKFFTTAKLLIESKVDLDLGQPLLYCIQNNILEMIELLLKNGATLEPKYLFHCFNLDTLKLLMKYNVQINYQGENRKTYIQYMIGSKLKIPISERLEIIKLILPYVDINHFYHGKNNLLMQYIWSPAYRYPQIRELLMPHDLNKKNDRGNVPLYTYLLKKKKFGSNSTRGKKLDDLFFHLVNGTDYYVRWNGSGDMVLDVLKSHFDLDDKYRMLGHIFNTKDVNINLMVKGRNVLYYTSIYGSSPEIITLMIKKGYDYKIKYPDNIDDKICHSMFSNLCLKNDVKFLKVLEILLPYTDINQFYEIKQSPLCRMINKKYFQPSTKIIAFLINNNANIPIDIIRIQVDKKFEFGFGINDERIVNNLILNNPDYVGEIMQLSYNHYKIINILKVIKYYINYKGGYEIFDNLLKETKIIKEATNELHVKNISNWKVKNFYEYGLSKINKTFFETYKSINGCERMFHDLYIYQMKWILKFYLKIIDMICYKNITYIKSAKVNNIL